MGSCTRHDAFDRISWRNGIMGSVILPSSKTLPDPGGQATQCQRQVVDSPRCEATMDPTTRHSVPTVLLFDPRDQALAGELEKHLSLIAGLEVWHSGKLLPGTQRHEVIKHHLDTCTLALVLVGPDLLATPDFETAMDVLEPRHRRGEVYVVPLLVRPSGAVLQAPGHDRAPPRWKGGRGLERS